MKQDVLNEIVKVLEKNIKSYETNLNTLSTNSDIDENATIDIDERSQQGEATDISARLREPLTAVENTLNAVKSFQDVARDDIGPGALVETENTYFFVGAALPPIEVNSKKVVGVTIEAPAYPSLEGKKKGDDFKLGDTKFKILSIS